MPTIARYCLRFGCNGFILAGGNPTNHLNRGKTMKHTTNAGPWTDAENAALVTLYFTMLDHATAGEAYNKAVMIREAQGEAPNTSPTTGIENTLHSAVSKAAPLRDRSRGSIEAKLMNASAAHADLDGAPTMDGYGYRALSNYQKTLKDAMRDALNVRSDDENDDQLGLAEFDRVQSS